MIKCWVLRSGVGKTVVLWVFFSNLGDGWTSKFRPPCRDLSVFLIITEKVSFWNHNVALGKLSGHIFHPLPRQKKPKNQAPPTLIVAVFKNTDVPLLPVYGITWRAAIISILPVLCRLCHFAGL